MCAALVLGGRAQVFITLMFEGHGAAGSSVPTARAVCVCVCVCVCVWSGVEGKLSHLSRSDRVLETVIRMRLHMRLQRPLVNLPHFSTLYGNKHIYLCHT